MSASLHGRWRQIAPDPAPAVITLTFHADGRFVYTIDDQQLALTWSVTEDRLLTSGGQSNRFAFDGQGRLVVGEHVYERV